MVAEIRRGQEFTKHERRQAKEDAGFCCCGCGRKIETKRPYNKPNVEALEVHHDPPIILGGGKDSTKRVLCGPEGCHKTVDLLAIEYGITFAKVVETLGEYPFRQYIGSIVESKPHKVARRVLRRIGILVAVA